MSSKKHILITGLPGVGKTTLIKKLCQELRGKDVIIDGFYTEEVRSRLNFRIGFDVVSISGEREDLARQRNCVLPFQMTNCTVGKYVVFPEKFEKIALPTFKNSNNSILILDEIGKMELFSNNFKKEIEQAFKTPGRIIIATIPVAKGDPIPLIEKLRKSPDSRLITVQTENRNDLVKEVLEMIL